ncbi:Hypothetical Protein RRSL_00350 [Ralstonia solanacearum UW551]|uniref:Uncharacterized protein n=1 Tax=Ralstonia solanacearum (strain UW551) TaxID=342110 RepID=A0AB33V7M0_RALSU|nr:Hypothetical Protein RRSL_00350 [Ralstonia solanacearum UW551]
MARRGGLLPSAFPPNQEVCHATRIDALPPPPGETGAFPPNPRRTHLSRGTAAHDGGQHGSDLPHARRDPVSLAGRWRRRLLRVRPGDQGIPQCCRRDRFHTLDSP